jgi:hypothetical protein
MIVGPISAALLSINPWVPILVGMGLVFLSMPLTIFIPETLELRQAADEQIRRVIHQSDGAAEGHSEILNDDNAKTTLVQRLVFSVRNDFTHVWRFLISTPGVPMLLLGYNLSTVIQYAKIELFLQYVHQRYGWSWQEVCRPFRPRPTIKRLSPD